MKSVEPQLSELPLEKNAHPRIDWTIFLPSLIIILVAGSYLVASPETAAGTTTQLMAFITSQSGWLFVLVGAAAFCFAMWLAFGRYNQVKLGLPDDQPEFSELSWAAMMFIAGIGIGIRQLFI